MPQPELFTEEKERGLTPNEKEKIDSVGKEVQTLAEPSQLGERQRLSNFNQILSRKPLLNMVRRYEIGNTKYDYLPIRYYERLAMQLFFGRVKYEIIHYGNVFNEMVVHTRFHYCHPVTGEWQYSDGVAAHQITQDADTKVADFALHKKGNALKTVMGAAYSESLKNAMKKLGVIFGGDLNRKIEDEYDAFTHTSKPLNA